MFQKKKKEEKLRRDTREKFKQKRKVKSEGSQVNTDKTCRAS